MKKNRIIAMLLGTALLVCGCQQTSKATDEEKKIESEKNTTKTEENAYQGKLDLITPAAYNNTDGLKLKKGDYISIIGKANGTQYWDEVKKGVAQAAEDIALPGSAPSPSLPYSTQGQPSFSASPVKQRQLGFWSAWAST